MTRDGYIKLSKRGLRGVLIGAAIVGAVWFLADRQPVAQPVAAEAPVFLGVPDDFKEKADVVQAAYPQPFQSVAPGIEDQDNTRKNVRLYEACPTLTTGPQKAGSCVGWGYSNAQYVTACVKAGRVGIPPPSSQFSPSYAYGIARVQIGRNSIRCGSDGAYPSDAVRGGNQYGYLLLSEQEEAGFKYTGQLDRDWGCKGPPKALIEIGQTRAGGDAYPIRSKEELRDAECNGYACTVAIPWKPGRVYRGHDGRSCIAFDGANQGGHQICCIGYDGSSGEPYWLLFNSHGPQWPDGVRHEDGTPVGSVWVDKKWAPWIFDSGEVWAISDVPGFEADELDLSIFDELRMSRAQAPRK